MSELSNSQGVRQPTVVGPSPEREWLTYAEAGEMVGLSRGDDLEAGLFRRDRSSASGPGGEDKPAEPDGLHEALGQRIYR
jgi:hypothetical protein